MRYPVMLLLLGLFGLWSCMPASNEREADEQQAREQSWSGDDEGKATVKVDYRALQAHFPDRLDGMDRVEKDGSQVSVFGFEVGGATARYEDEERWLDIAIAQGAIMQVAARSLEAAELEFEENDGDSYKRSLEIDGYKAIEEYDARRKEGQLVVFLENYIVTLEGRGLPEGALRKYYQRLDLPDEK